VVGIVRSASSSKAACRLVNSITRSRSIFCQECHTSKRRAVRLGGYRIALEKRDGQYMFWVQLQNTRIISASGAAVSETRAPLARRVDVLGSMNHCARQLASSDRAPRSCPCPSTPATAIGAAFCSNKGERNGGMVDVEFKLRDDLTRNLTGFSSRLLASNYNRNYLLGRLTSSTSGAAKVAESGLLGLQTYMTKANFPV